MSSLPKSVIPCEVFSAEDDVVLVAGDRAIVFHSSDDLRPFRDLRRGRQCVAVTTDGLYSLRVLGEDVFEWRVVPAKISPRTGSGTVAVGSRVYFGSTYAADDYKSPFPENWTVATCRACGGTLTKESADRSSGVWGCLKDEYGEHDWVVK